MTHLSTALKNDLEIQSAELALKGNYDLSAVMGNLVTIVEIATKHVGVEEMTLAEEFQHFNEALNKHLDWQSAAAGFSIKNSRKARKIVNQLTESDYLV